MAKKGNIRSIRFSDEMAEMIDQQIGDTFTAKFEALVTRCMWELPQKEAQLKHLDEQIKKRQGQLLTMSEQVRQLEITINDLFPKLKMLKAGIDRAVQKWDT